MHSRATAAQVAPCSDLGRVLPALRWPSPPQARTWDTAVLLLFQSKLLPGLLMGRVGRPWPEPSEAT